MPHQLLTPDEMAAADALAIEIGPFDISQLMENAGAAVVRTALQRFPEATGYAVLCGPGNNGGDGYVAARILSQHGLAVAVWRDGAPRPGSAAAVAASRWKGATQSLSAFHPVAGHLVVDALYGAGLSKPLGNDAANAAAKCADAGSRVLSVDLPSGVSGADGTVTVASFRADATVTFVRRKPGHLLLPGRERCGEVVVADIGVPDRVLNEIETATFANEPGLWRVALPAPIPDTHKYKRGHAAVFSGGPSATGAARLAAMAAARAGAGAVTVLSPAHAMLANSAHLTSVMLARIDGVDELHAFMKERRSRALVLGPGFGVGERARSFVLSVLGQTDEDAAARTLVLDADGITSFRDEPEQLFAAAHASKTALVLTPHDGEFARLFPDLAELPSKLERARKAAQRSHGVVICKGPDTVTASPDGRTAINTNGTPLLATAGSGDVLAGIVAGLAAQGMPEWEASCAAVWMHAEAARNFGPGVIAEDLPDGLPQVLRDLLQLSD